MCMLAGCSRSKSSKFYVLNPIPPKKFHTQPYKSLRIGIDEVNSPGYLEKPQLVIRKGANQLKLEEYHRWAEAIDKNLMRVIETNLSTLLPGAIVESSPWDATFVPTHHLQVDISQFEVDIHGNSILRADFVIYHKLKLIKKRSIYYHQKLPQVTIDTVVASMNHNLTKLSRTITTSFKKNTNKRRH
jgi:uncharacterized protein